MRLILWAALLIVGVDAVAFGSWFHAEGWYAYIGLGGAALCGLAIYLAWRDNR